MGEGGTGGGMDLLEMNDNKMNGVHKYTNDVGHATNGAIFGSCT